MAADGKTDKSPSRLETSFFEFHPITRGVPQGSQYWAQCFLLCSSMTLFHLWPSRLKSMPMTQHYTRKRRTASPTLNCRTPLLVTRNGHSSGTVIIHTSRVLRCWRLWPCRFDYFQANRAAPGNCLDHALLGNHGLVEMSGQFRTLALCYYVSSWIASACARKARLPDAGSHRRQILILHHRTVHH